MDGDKGFVLRPPCEGRGVPGAPFTAPLMGLVSRVQQRDGARIRDLLNILFDDFIHQLRGGHTIRIEIKRNGHV